MSPAPAPRADEAMSTVASVSGKGAVVELVLVGGCGLATALLADLWFGAFHLGGPWTSADFQDYCAGVYSLMTGGEDFPVKRARLAGVLAAWSGASDVVRALQRGAWLGAAGVFVGLAAWARTLGGRWAVPFAMAMALAVSPIVLTSRMYTFYPAMNAVFVLGSAAVCVAMVRPRLGSMLGAGIAVGLALSVDVRGLLWAGPWGLGLVLALLGRRARRWSLWAALVVPVLLSYGLGAWSFPADALSLEQQLDVRPLAEYRAGGEEARSAWRYASRFVWGESAPWAALGTLAFLWRNQRAAPEALGELADFTPIIESQLDPWLGPLCVGLCASVVGLRRQGWKGLALGVTVLPFGLALWAARSSVELQLRFLSQALVVVPLAVGVALGVWRPCWRHRLAGLAWAGVLTSLLLSIFGAIPGPLSPMADWRQTWPPNTLDYMRTTHRNAYTHLRPEFRVCRVALGLPVLEGEAGPAPPQQLRGEDFQPISPPVAPR